MAYPRALLRRRVHLAAIILMLPALASAATVALRPVRDTAIYKDVSLSNGAGLFLFAGSTDQPRVLRSLVGFDLAGQIPAGATVNSVTVTFGITTPRPSNSNTVRLHRVTANWSEGASVATMGEGVGAPATTGDATWTHRIFNTAPWATPGGDFVATPSAAERVSGGSGSVTFRGAGLVADVQAWLANPGSNFGWILVADPEAGDAVRLSSREGPSPPQLVIDFTPGTGGGGNVAPTFATHPASQTVAPGATITLTASASGTPAPTYQWQKDGAALPGATTASLTLSNVTIAHAGSYVVIASNSAGNTPSNAAIVTVATAPPPPGGINAWLANLSILTDIATPGDAFTMGFVVGGAGTAGTKSVLIRAVGPSLVPLGVTGALADPRLETFSGTTPTGTNDNWGGSAALSAAFSAVGAFAYTGPASLDAAVLASLGAGDNSVRVAATGNGTGTVIAELYDSTPSGSFSASTPRLVNVSVLKHIGTGLTAGFVIAGTGAQTVLIRAVGPTIGAAPFNVPGAIADPQIALLSGQTVVTSNDNWGGTVALTAAFAQVGAFSLPPGSRDAAIVASLQPGPYTVQVTGVGNTTGVAIVEVYEVR